MKYKAISALISFSLSMVSFYSLGGTESAKNDPRQPIDRLHNHEYNAIGIVKSSIGRGSGWLGNDCLVWSAKHVFGRNKKIIDQKAKFFVGQRQEKDGKAFEYEITGKVIASGNPDANDSDDGGEDWALIRLDTPIGKEVGFITTAQYSVTDAATCATLEVAGYPGEKSEKHLWRQSNCVLDSDMSDITGMTVGCLLSPGNSGGPLLCRETDGSLVTIGIMNQEAANPHSSIAVNFTADWPNAKNAYIEFKDSCN